MRRPPAGDVDQARHIADLGANAVAATQDAYRAAGQDYPACVAERLASPRIADGRMNLVEATDNFNRATQHCDNLITVHRGHGGPSRGRRAEEVSLNRAVVVLAVASWQSVIQDYVLAALDMSAPAAGDRISSATYSVISGRVRREVGAFATPNAQNSRNLLIGVGFDPRPDWTWRQRGGRGVGMVTVTPADVDTQIDEWLRVRHAIAHGHRELPQVNALEVVRSATGGPPLDPTIRLADAEQCLPFFRRLTTLTGAALAAHLGVPAP